MALGPRPRARLRLMADGNQPGPGSPDPVALKSGADIAAGVDVMAGISMTYGTVLPWQDLWRSVVAELEQLEGAYLGALGQQNGDALKRLPTLFCQDCWHLKNWLSHDPMVPAKAATAAEAYARKPSAIKDAGDVANTHKHYGRNVGHREARVGKMESWSEKGLIKVKMRIDWKDPGGASGSIDALKLATQAVAEWRAFFKIHGLIEKG
jgi:hypothetical protein